MKRVHVARHAPEAHLVKGYLESEGIAATVRGDLLAGGWGELPVDLCGVWIIDDERAAEANALLVRFLKGTPAAEAGHERWTCAGCGETLEGQFTSCWNCGAAREARSADP